VNATRPGRWFNRAALASAVLLACTVALWLVAFFLNPAERHLAVTESFRVGVWGGPICGRLVFFNTADGPYHGSIIALSDGQGNSHPRLRARGWGDSWGVYYRHFYFFDSGETVWTLMISLLYPLALFAILPVAWAWRRWRSGERFNR
jgi:hypothetical protein